ncbi:hypothetical protein H9Q13_03740 [Pontibacter sp. JH31]|uniref:Lipoprotein n=1 Tax=Pontibacter aquaedesilientis TaxID=2766980 RepID=A0ABR7XFA7_9BACT|nr:hypothetical protein [Pontibacter aquaedesilientis]MBD1396268.1 hypothetical protein [Pontibacter aquaedesilientis]
MKTKLKQPLAFVLACSFFLLSCESSTVSHTDLPPEPDTSVRYIIKKGEQSTQSTFKMIATSKIRFEAVFDQSAIYTSTLPANQADINKLYGASDCGTAHHTNSARFGWRWYNGRLEIHGYTYFNSKRNTAYITSVKLGEPSTYELTFEDNQYRFAVNGESIVLPRSCAGITEGYQLYPYFGGNELAPHNITISIKELP